LPSVDADPQHEVLVVELLGLQVAGFPAVNARPALGIQAEPAEAPAQVGRVDRVEAVLGVNVDNPVADVQPVVVLLELFVLVQRLTVAKCPLAVTAARAAAWLAPGIGKRGSRAVCGAARRWHVLRPFGHGARAWTSRAPACAGELLLAHASGALLAARARQE